ncbi:MAG: sulfatase-like hydrolase/transferase [Rhodospirillaceae bacterium]|jgi:arylsulfatase A-like enzyme|nr:sulfatase-like hydrolase/transferase [Rhodospirillaceae bacterium]MBT5458593.1 sulfatase-like hydrolase/transferase [Rhodospirillaceae bacterium]
MAERPNFVFIITDQHRADHLGCYGNSTVRTPHIDSLAKRGTMFDRFYVANPVCQPNRASLMTGRMPSLHGVRNNGIPLSRDHVTFVELLAAAGYHTGLVGKSHLQNMTGRPPPVEYEIDEGKIPPPEGLREASRRPLAGPDYDNENARLWSDPAHQVQLPFYGFREARICTGHGDIVGGDYRRWLEEKQPGASALIGEDNAIPDQRSVAPQAWRTAVPEELYPTNYVKELSCDFIERQAESENDTPFFLQVSFPDPHHPFTPPGKYWDMFDPDQMTLPSSFDAGDLAPLRWMREELAAGTADRGGPLKPFAVTAAEAKTIIALTYGMIAMVDDAIGEILATIDRAGLTDDTIVIFTADHGDFMADHGIMLKYMLHYQGLIRVPCIVADPRSDKSGAVRSDLAGTIDIGPTVLGRAGLQSFNGMQGRDLSDTSLTPRDSIVIEEDTATVHFGNDTVDRVRTLVTDRWRLTYHHFDSWWELYDLQEDPDENKNLWDAPNRPAEADALVRKMISQLVELNDTSPLPTARA